jgi:hypothetical protein
MRSHVNGGRPLSARRTTTAVPHQAVRRKPAPARVRVRSDRVVRWTFKVRDRCVAGLVSESTSDLSPSRLHPLAETHALDPTWSANS